MSCEGHLLQQGLGCAEAIVRVSPCCAWLDRAYNTQAQQMSEQRNVLEGIVTLVVALHLFTSTHTEINSVTCRPKLADNQ